MKTSGTQTRQPVREAVREGQRSCRTGGYEPPRIVFEEPLESFATVCSPPAKSNPVTCAAGPISS